MDVEYISLSTTPIYLRKGQKVVSQGTGFFYGREDSRGQFVCLVTNYHVLMGSAPTTNRAPDGDNIVFQFHLSETETGRVKEIVYPLFTKNGEPVWIQSNSFPEADVAIIPIAGSMCTDAKVYALSEGWCRPDIRLRPTISVTLVGYPHGFFDKKNALPIWKTGSIASEPYIDFEGKPLFLVDVSAFRGMSGSPVFVIKDSSYEDMQGMWIVSSQVERRFLGVFSSMPEIKRKQYIEEIPKGTKPGIILRESLQLGFVWKVGLIFDIIKEINVEKYEKEILRHLS